MHKRLLLLSRHPAGALAALYQNAGEWGDREIPPKCGKVYGTGQRGYDAIVPMLEAIFAELHVFNGVVNWTQPVRFGVALAGRPFFQVSARGGDQVEFKFDGLQPLEMGKCGRIEVHDLTDRLDPALRGREVGEPCVIQDGRGSPIGLALPRLGGQALCLWINDDEFYWGDEDALRVEKFPHGLKVSVGTVLESP